MVMWMMLACPKVDQEAWRMDTKEQQVLFSSAEEYWLGVRWGELSRSAQYIEDPLERARFLNSFVSGQYIEIKVLHAELEPIADDFEITPEIDVWRTGTVYIQVEQVLNGHQVVNQEQQQDWIRKSSGWFIKPPEDLDIK